MDVKDIGIKKNFKIYQTFLTAAFAIFCVLTVIFLICCYCDYYDERMLRNGIEVEAEIVDIREIDILPDDSTTTERAWECIYRYVAEDGTKYSGVVGQFSQKKYAVEHIGEKVNIVIDPTDGSSTYGTLSGIAYYWQKHHQSDFILACVFSGLLSIAAYLFFYRVVYRNRLDKKILEHASGRFVSNCVCKGEITKVLKWMVCYVKVKYQDGNGVTREKWAQSWFTHKEAKFLQEKKTITIVPYKNTYGILEEMQ